MKLEGFSCPYAEVHGKPPATGERDLRGVVCSRIVALVGVRCGHAIHSCGDCEYVASGDDLLIRRQAKAHIRNLLVSGNGRVNYADTVDVPGMAARYLPMSTKGEREEIVAKAIECQSIPEEKGGYDAETIARNLEELARELDVSDVLERIV